MKPTRESGFLPPGRTLHGAVAILAALALTAPLFAVVAARATSSPPLFTDGFESGTSSWTKAVSFSVQSTTKLSGSSAGEAMSAGAGRTFVSETLASPEPDVYARTWFDEISRGTKVTVLKLRSPPPTASMIFAVGTTRTGHLYTLNAATGVKTTSPNVVDLGSWHEVQVHVLVGGTSSLTEVWLDGARADNLTAVAPLGTAPVGRVEVGESGGNRTYDVAFDDAVIDTAYIAPATPANVSATPVSSTQVNLSWNPPPASDGSVVYTIYRASDPSSPPTGLGTSSTTAFSDISGVPGKTYYYSVDAADRSGHRSPPSSPPTAATTQPPSGPPPARPTGLVAQAPGSHDAELTWTANSGDAVSSYVVYRAPDGVTPSPVGSATTSHFTDTSVSSSTTYSYSVTAVNAGGESPASDQASATTPSADDPVVAAAGDIACDPADPSFGGTASRCQQRTTASLLGSGLAAILPLGDLQYDCGGKAAFDGSYGPSWGQYLANTFPVPGNHEYRSTAQSAGTDCSASQDAAGFYSYFAQAPYFSTVSGNPAGGYYSFDVGGWHIIALNAECSFVGGCGQGSPQEVWLRGDLAAHPTKCTLAYWHQPRFADANHVSNPVYDTFWKDLYAAGADLVANGHVHAYERYAPMAPDGSPDPIYGIRQMIAGTGGEDHAKITNPLPTDLAHDARTFGVLFLTLHPTSYEWSFVPANGAGNGTFTDSGATMCHDAPQGGGA